jgi:hypothetical protein
MSQWYLDGYKVIANCFGNVVTGTVESSRVKYGGRVQHTVILDAPLTLRWRSEPVSRVLIDDINIIERNTK